MIALDYHLFITLCFTRVFSINKIISIKSILARFFAPSDTAANYGIAALIAGPVGRD